MFDYGSRPFDSETKVIETYRRMFNSDSTGTIYLYSERPVCRSCRGVIK